MEASSGGEADSDHGWSFSTHVLFPSPITAAASFSVEATGMCPRSWWWCCLVGGRRRPLPTGAGEVAWCASSTTSASGLLRSSEHALCFPDHEHKHEHDDLLCLSSLCCWVGRLPLSCSIFWLAFSSSLASGLLPHSPSISYLSFSPLLYFDFFSCVVIRQDRSNHFVMLIIVFYRSAC
jgi:hypothetical protein